MHAPKPDASAQRARSSCRLWSSVATSVLCLWGCGGTPDALKDHLDDSVLACAELRDGDSCGDAHHCRAGRCRPDFCGDAVVAGDEACDDGNRDSHDGCDSECQLEIESCAGEAGEGCDAGSHAEHDGCAGDCGVEPKPKCGNGSIEPEGGEECDGAHIVTDDAGAGHRQGCSADCKLIAAHDPCEECQNAHCTDYSGLDLVDGCFHRVNTSEGGLDDPEFIQRCIDSVNCALTNDCAFDDPVQGASACYCGSADNDTCYAAGPAADAPCVREWQAGSRSDSNGDVFARFSDLAYPSAWAFFLLECYRLECSAECVTGP